MDEDRLIELLPELSPERLFSLPVELLLSSLPSVSVEQLIGEIPPEADPIPTEDSPTQQR